MRLRTTSISADKYADTLDVLLDLYKNEQAEAVRLGIKLLTDSLSMQMKLPENYKLIIKAFGSKNLRVINATFKLVKEIGDLDERATQFVDSTASQGLIKLYKSSDDN